MAIELRDACNFSGSKPVRPRRGSESKFSRKMEIPGSDQVTPDRPNIIYYQIDPKPKRDICVLPLSEANEAGTPLSRWAWMAYA